MAFSPEMTSVLSSGQYGQANKWTRAVDR